MNFSLKGFIAAVIVCVIIISAKYFYSGKLSAQIDKGICRAAQLKHVENLYIGSSMFRKGINLHEDNSKSFVINYNGLDPVLESLILEQLLRGGLKVENLYVDMYAFSAARPSWPGDLRLMFDSPAELKLKIWRNTMKDPRAEIFAATWELFGHAENGMFLLWPLYRKFAAARYDRGGYTLSNIRPGRTLEEFARADPPSVERLSLDITQKSAIVKIVELCRENGVNVIFAETPKYSGLNSNSEYLSLMKEYIELLNDCDVKYIVSRSTADGTGAAVEKNAYVYDFPYEDPALFEDYVHLSTEGSRKFMRVLSSSRHML